MTRLSFAAFKAIVSNGRINKTERDSATDVVLFSVQESLEEERMKQFRVVAAAFAKFKLDSSNCVLDSIALRANKNSKQTTYWSGTFYFRTNDRTAFYKMHFTDMASAGNVYGGEYLLLPFVYIGPRNRMLAAPLKPRYIDTCLHDVRNMIRINPTNKAFYTSCHRCFCEEQYFTETEQEDGVNKVKEYINKPAADLFAPGRRK